jgi:membrane protease YdiL (CAAX protease family)
LSSPDNPQFDPQPASLEPPASAPFVTGSFPPVGIPPVPPAQPRENPVWSGWDVLQIAALTLVASILLELTTVLVAMRFVYPHASFSDVAQKPVLSLLSEFLAYIAVASFMVALVEGKYHLPFWRAIQWNWPRSVWKLFGLGVLVLFTMNFLGHFLPMPKSTPFDQFFAKPRDAYLVSIFAIAIGPLMEELFFRGFLYPVLARRMGVGWGIFFTALPFGLIHMFQYGYAWGVVLLIFLMGAVCTAVRAVTKSVAASFLVHVGYNATEMVLFAIVTDGFRHMEKAGMILN